MRLVEGKTYKFKPLCELKNCIDWNHQGRMDYLAGTVVTVNCLLPGGYFLLYKKGTLGTWTIWPSMLEEVCEPDESVYPYFVAITPVPLEEATEVIPEIKTVDSVISAFSSVLADLKEVETTANGNIEYATQRIKELQDGITADTAEATRAKAIAGKIEGLLK